MKSYLIGSVIAVAAFGFSIWGAYSKGQHSIQVQWDLETKSQQDKYRLLEDKYATLRRQNTALQKDTDAALERQEKEYAQALVDSSTNFADGVRKSEGRAEWYRKQAEAGTIEQHRLAEHAAKLDASIVEGKRVAADLAATVRLRDEQIIELGRLLNGVYAIVEDSNK